MTKRTQSFEQLFHSLTKAVVFSALLTAPACKRDRGALPPEAVIQIPAATYAEDTAVRYAVETECALQTKLPQWVERYARGGAAYSPQPDESRRVLTIEVEHVIAPGGGAWSGRKSLTVTGTLTEGEKTVGSFIARRSTDGGMFRGFQGTCGMLDRCGRTLGKDIARWLEHPRMDDVLGELSQ